MATPPTPATQTANAPVLTGTLNSYRDGINFWSRSGSNVAPICFAYQTVATINIIPGSGTPTAVHFDTDVAGKDTDNMHLTTPSGSNSFFTVNTTGTFLAVAQVIFNATTTGQDILNIAQNGTVMHGNNAGFINAQHRLQASGILFCTAGDIITPQVSCGTANTLQGTTQGGTYFSMAMISL